jgi:SSS family solute:Na+ symporter
MGSGGVILLALVAAVTVMGFAASRWRSGNLSDLSEWALGGRRFGTVVSWFLLGGDLYTAYTFIAVPALVYGVGALGFFAVPYAIVAYPIALVVLSRFYRVARERGYMTSADFVRDRFGSRSLELAIAFTGVVAAMPYIALQLIGMKAVFVELGGPFARDAGAIALSLAFIVLAAYTVTSGLRAPAMIAFVKDTLVYVTVIAAVVIIPQALGGWSHLIAVAGAKLATRPHPGATLLAPAQYFTYATMALGSSLSLFIYPHAITSVLASKNVGVLRRNAALLPIYSILLGLLALLGYCAIAAGIAGGDPTTIVPRLFTKFFPDWFAGVADAAVVIGALVPAAIMAIGAANLCARNIMRGGGVRAAKGITLAICAFALLLAILIDVPYAIDFQLLGGALMLQIFPAFVFGLWTRWFDPRALLLGWACGFASSCAMAIASHFSSTIAISVGGLTLNGFIALYALIVNLAVASVATLLANARKVAA